MLSDSVTGILIIMGAMLGMKDAINTDDSVGIMLRLLLLIGGWFLILHN